MKVIKLNFICLFIVLGNVVSFAYGGERSYIMSADTYAALAPGESMGVPALVKYNNFDATGVVEGKSILSLSNEKWGGDLPKGLNNLGKVFKSMGIQEDTSSDYIILYLGYKYCNLCNNIISNEDLISDIKNSFKEYDFLVIEIDHMRYLESKEHEE